jgi:hypothetical protein
VCSQASGNRGRAGLARYNFRVKRLLFVAGAICVLLACSKNIQNSEAVKQSVLDYLKSRPGIGLNLEAMDIQVSNVRFSEKEANAEVAFVPKGRPADSGMSMNYKLEREGDKWIVKSKAMASMGGVAAPAAGAETGGADPAAAPPPSLPAGHVPVPAAKGN